MQTSRGRWLPGAALAAVIGLAGTVGLAACGSAVAAHAAGPVSSPVPRGTAGAGPSDTTTPLWLVRLTMVTPDAGWALGYTTNPAAPGSQAVAVPVRTTDGGRSWNEVTPAAARSLLTPAHTAQALYALNAEQAWLAVSRSGGGSPSRTVVYATSDGGRTWRAYPASGFPGSPRFMYFTGPRHGWLLADLGAAMGTDAVAVLATADGGAHWTVVARTPSLTGGGGTGGLPLACAKTGIVFATRSVGWITGDCTARGPLVEVTRDGGRTWTPQALPGIPPSPAGGAAAGAGGAAGNVPCSAGSEAAPPAFTGSTGYLGVSCYPQAALFVTHDTGTTWSPVTLPPGAGPYPVAEFTGPAQGVLVPRKAQGIVGDVFYHTADGGRTWQAVHATRSFGAGTTVDFVTPAAGLAWVPGTDSASGPPPLCRTGDGGEVWACAVPHVTTSSPG